MKRSENAYTGRLAIDVSETRADAAAAAAAAHARARLYIGRPSRRLPLSRS